MRIGIIGTGNIGAPDRIALPIAGDDFNAKAIVLHLLCDPYAFQSPAGESKTVILLTRKPRELKFRHKENV